VARAVVLLTCAALCLAACGSSKQAAAPPAPVKKRPPAQCTSPAAMAKLNKDIAAMRRAADLPTKDTLIGNAQINAATDKFLRDVELAKIDNKRRNRMIDHAAGTLAGACGQCFQALEAERPVIGIRLGVSGCG
jgi:hypothetical protein